MKTCNYQDDFTYPDVKMHFHVHYTNYAELHNHDYWEFFIVLSGSIEHTASSGKQVLQNGMAYLVHPQDKHSLKNCSADYSQVNFCITDEYFKELLDLFDPKLYAHLCAAESPVLYHLNENILQEIREILHNLQTIGIEKEYYQTLLKFIWMDIIKIIYLGSLGSNRDYPQWLNAFIAALHRQENIRTPMADLSKLTFYSYRQLTRLFKQYTGETLNEYTMKIRLNYAASLLRSTDMGILDISSQVGYDSLSYFIKTFQKYFHASPSKYRNSFSIEKTSFDGIKAR